MPLGFGTVFATQSMDQEVSIMKGRDLVAGAGIGAALAYILDPNRGNYRRAIVRDKVTRATRITRDGLSTTARDVGNRMRGIAAATNGRLYSEDVSDERLVERVRAKLGRACSHPRAIDVFARDGEVTMRGPILAHEVEGVIALTSSVRGVRQVINELEAHASSEGVPSLQGDGRVAEPAWDILQHRWAPATKALVSVSALATGLCLAAYARRGREGQALTT
jgi:osmotically-inducible protein OsmY